MAYTLVRDFVYELGQTYSGAGVESTFTFSTPKGPIAGPIADGIISNLEQQCLTTSGCPPMYTLRTRIWVDSTPALTDDYMVTFDLYCPEQHSPQPWWVVA
jgi:hypothetical protein